MLTRKYQHQIQQIVTEAKHTPRSEEILRQLLQNFIQMNTYSRWHFLAVPDPHVEFAKKLLSALTGDEKNYKYLDLQQLENYLSQKKLDEKSDFLALLIAYFNYYTDKYDFSKYPNIKQQILLKLRDDREAMVREQQEYYLTLLSSRDGNTVVAALLSLEAIILVQTMSLLLYYRLLKIHPSILR